MHHLFFFSILSSPCTPTHSSTYPTLPPSTPRGIQSLEQTPKIIVPHSIPSRLNSCSSKTVIACGVSCTSKVLSAPQLLHLGIPFTTPTFAPPELGGESNFP